MMFAVVLFTSSLAWLPGGPKKGPNCRPCKYMCAGCGSENPPAHCDVGLCANDCASDTCLEKMCSKKFKDNCDGCTNDSNYKCMWNTVSGCHYAQTADPTDTNFVFECPAEEMEEAPVVVARGIEARIDYLIEKIAREYSSVNPMANRKARKCAKYHKLARAAHDETEFDNCADCSDESACAYDADQGKCVVAGEQTGDKLAKDNCPGNPCIDGSSCTECLAEGAGCFYIGDSCLHMKSNAFFEALTSGKGVPKHKKSQC